MNIFDEINLPQASKQLVSLILKKGGTLEPISGTNAYLTKFNRKEYIFLGEFTPLTPYMYGIVFSNQRYWFEILKELNITHAWDPRGTQKKILFLMTKNSFFNAILEKNTVIIGNGRDSVRTLIGNENMRRINRKEAYVMPINSRAKSSELSRVPKDGEEVKIEGNYDYEDISTSIDKNLVRKVERTINYLPGLPFIRVEIFVKNPRHADSFTLGKVSVSQGVNIFFDTTDGKKFRNTGEELLSMLLL